MKEKTHLQLNDIRIGTIIHYDSGNASRVIYRCEDQVVVCQMNISSLVLTIDSVDNIGRLLQEGKPSIENLPSSLPPDLKAFKEKTVALFYRRKQMIEKINQLYGPSYLALDGRRSKSKLYEVMKKYNTPRTTFWRVITTYLQSGLDIYSLLPNKAGRKPMNHEKPLAQNQKLGRKATYGTNGKGKALNSEDFDHFDFAIRFYLKNRSASLVDAYDEMKNHFYITNTPSLDHSAFEYLPLSEIPTYRQFYYYASKNISFEEKQAAKTSKREYNNDKRLLLGSAKTGVYGAADFVEVDAHECDTSLIEREFGRDAVHTVGRPIIYIMIDVATGMILGASCAFDNNSLIGITNCFASLKADKHDLCQKYGVSFSDDSLWPSNVRPHAMRCDKGSEFISDPVHRIMKELGITIATVAPASGSLKGTVEHFFAEFERRFNAVVEKHGLITQRYDSNHHQHATLNYNDFTKMFLTYVLYHNCHYMATWIKTPDMLDHGIMPIPAVLWKFQISRYGSPKPLPDDDEFLWALLIEKSAGISRRGIFFEKLTYLPESDPELLETMKSQQNRKMKMNVRYDPRCIDYIYYRRNSTIYRARINTMIPEQREFLGLTITQLHQYQEAAKSMDASGMEYNEDRRGKLKQELETAMNDAAKMKGPRRNVTKNMKEARDREKQQIEKEHSLSETLLMNQTDNPDHDVHEAAGSDDSIANACDDDYEQVDFDSVMFGDDDD